MKITPRKDGPLRLEGENITLVDEAGTQYDLAGRTVVSLCRCGFSQNKPFCDGSHAKHGFAAESAAFALPPPKPKA
jgi:CDGSH-type Zn-finger protein